MKDRLIELLESTPTDFDGRRNVDIITKYLLENGVVEVVRCKHCKYFKTSINKENYCELHSAVWYKFYIRADDFCSYGKRGVNNG